MLHREVSFCVCVCEFQFAFVFTLNFSVVSSESCDLFIQSYKYTYICRVYRIWCSISCLWLSLDKHVTVDISQLLKNKPVSFSHKRIIFTTASVQKLSFFISSAAVRWHFLFDKVVTTYLVRRSMVEPGDTDMLSLTSHHVTPLSELYSTRRPGKATLVTIVPWVSLRTKSHLKTRRDTLILQVTRCRLKNRPDISTLWS